MLLTKKADYGIRIVLELSKMPSGTLISTKELARRQGIPLPFLSKIVAELASAQILETKRGAKGGVKLSVSPEAISLLDIMEAVDGPVGLSYCAVEPGRCHREPHCSIRCCLMKVQETLRNELQNISIASLVQTESTLQS